MHLTQRRLSSALGIELLGLDLRRDPLEAYGSQLLRLLDLLYLPVSRTPAAPTNVFPRISRLASRHCERCT
jgi:hypothetical protein